MDHRSWNRALFCSCILFGLGVATAKKSEKELVVSLSSGGGGEWCVASKGALDNDLKVALDWACGKGGADCTAIQPGARCYNPNTMSAHASYAFNDYYQKHPVAGSCVFGGTAELTTTDPSTPNCPYASSGSPSGGPPSPSGSQSSPPPSPSGGGQPSIPTPPAAGGEPSPAFPSPPGSPTGSPTSAAAAAATAFYSWPLLFISGLLAAL